ncbi:ABC transporter substrate-binding protein [Methylobacterium iners]|uniref:Leucine-binding protein domain-containing protein n=1 Tax=Methylobacterium iners TaxID=418707 RepID=A0ABQ4S420_9HYPH|nr:ABC transporter substrate-binding protein [Methylobacterium iners]GJD96435.1 hypothetical protein OCOJLMKI_3656 [Methylobacterium iners]
MMSIRALRLAALCVALLHAGSAVAAEPIVLSLLTNRTGPSSAVGARVANGMRDYLEMLNQRDGGIGGTRVQVEECEVASDLERGLACYEAARKAGAVLVSPPDRALTRALVEPSARDRIPLLSLADGFPIGTRGDVMPWVFNPSAWVLGGLTITVSYLAEKAGGLGELKDLSIGLAYSTGADPAALATLRDLAARYGFATPLFALEETERDDEVWERIGRQPPNHLILLGQGVQAGISVERALKVGFPADRLIALRWPDEAVLRKAGSAGRGFKEISRHAFGDAFPAFDEIDLHVVDRGLSRTPKTGSGETHYNRGIYNAVLLAEAIRNAQRRGAPGALKGEDLRRGLETLSIDDVRWKELGLSGFARAVAFTCMDHGGHPPGFVQVWDGAKWLPAAGPIPQMSEAVDARLDQVVAEFLGANPGWPARAEPCDQPPT